MDLIRGQVQGGGVFRAGGVDVYHFPHAGVTICYAANLSGLDVSEEGTPIGYFDIIQEAVEAVFLQ